MSRIESPFSEHIPQDLQSVATTEVLKEELLKLLYDFPYEIIHLENDVAIASRIVQLNDVLKLDLNVTHIPKHSLISALLGPTTAKPFLDPVRHVCSHFELVNQSMEKKKQEHYNSLQSINKDLEMLGQLLGYFQNSTLDQKVDFSKNPDIIQLIEKVKVKFGFPLSGKPYIWDNKNDVTGFLNQKTKELTHRSSETMIHLQHDADGLKSMVDITRNMIEEDAKVKDYMNRKAGS